MTTIDETIAIAQQEWREYGIGPQERVALAADLRADLESAAAEGITPDLLIGRDLRDFARRLADEAGAQRTPYAYRRVIRVALTGIVLGTVAGYLIITEVVHPLLVSLFNLPQPNRVPLWLAAVVYLGAVTLFSVAGATLALRLRLHALPGIRRTTYAMMLLLPIAGALVTPVVLGFGWLMDYSFHPLVVSTEIGLVLAAAGGAVAIARRWSLRRPVQQRHPVTA